MKKIIALILVLVLIFTLSACGTKEAEKKDNAPNNTEQSLSDLELGKKLLKEGKDAEAYDAFLKSNDPEAQIYLKCFTWQETIVEDIKYKADGTVFSKIKDGYAIYLSCDLGSYEFELGYDEYGNPVYTSKNVVGNFTASDLLGAGIYPTDCGALPSIYEYDERGNVIRKTREDFDGSVMSYTEYTYDKNNNILTQVTFNKDFSLTIPTIKYEYTYDQNNNCIVELEYSYGELEWKTEYTYDKKGNEVKAEYYEGNGESCGWEEYTYDDKGNMILKLEYDADGKLESKTESTYDKNNNLLKSVEQDGSGAFVGTTEYAYDSESNKLLWAYYDGNNNVMEMQKFDKYGRLIYDMAGYTAAGKLIAEEYTFDNKGNLILVDKHTEDGETLEKTEYKYDENSVKVSEVREVFTGEYTGKWVTEYENGVRRREARYNLEGFLQSERLYDKHGSPIFDPNVKVDEMGLPIKISTNEYEEDSEGRAVVHKRYDDKNELMFVHTYEYDEKGNVLKRTDREYTDGELDYTSVDMYEYDKHGNRTYEATYFEGVIKSETKYSFTPVYDPQNAY